MAEAAAKSRQTSSVIMGKAITAKTVSINEIDIDSSRVVVEGDIFSTAHGSCPAGGRW